MQKVIVDGDHLQPGQHHVRHQQVGFESAYKIGGYNG